MDMATCNAKAKLAGRSHLRGQVICHTLLLLGDQADQLLRFQKMVADIRFLTFDIVVPTLFGNLVGWIMTDYVEGACVSLIVCYLTLPTIRFQIYQLQNKTGDSW